MAGVASQDWPFKDGEAPPSAIIKKWNALLDSMITEDGGTETPKPAIAIHCVAGLGRYAVVETRNRPQRMRWSHSAIRRGAPCFVGHLCSWPSG